MTRSTISTIGKAEVRFPIQRHPQAAGAEENVLPVCVRFQGQWVDLMTAIDHWGIEIDWQGGQRVSRIRDEWVVYGTLSVEKPQAIL